MSLVQVDAISRRFNLSSSLESRIFRWQATKSLLAVDQVSFSIDRGTTYALVGESGSGKSTIARMIVGLLRPSAGRIQLDGVDFNNSDLNMDNQRAMRRRIQMVFQSPYASLNPRWRIGSILAEPLRAFNLHSTAKNRQNRVVELLEQVGLSESDARKYPHEFSGGQRQRISIARALASEPEFIVCDEPTSALDVSVQAQVLNLLKQLQQDHGLTYLFISHDLAVVSVVATKIGVLKKGQLVEEQDSRDLFANPKEPYTKMLLRSVPNPFLCSSSGKML